MQNGIHFISGLPRSGSTLLAALLRQNPRFHAGMTSPVGSLFSALLRQMSQDNETAVFIDDDQRARLLRACSTPTTPTSIPTSWCSTPTGMWTTKLPALVELFPDRAWICCVRNPAWIIDSVERLIRRNAFELSKIFNFDPGGTVYSRVEGLASGDRHGRLRLERAARGGLWRACRPPAAGALRDADREPAGHARRDLRFHRRAVFPHDPTYRTRLRAMEFDARLGTPGLHAVGRAVRAQARPTILPPDLFPRFENDAFWQDPAKLPPTVRIV